MSENKWPEPTVERPSAYEISGALFEATFKATDGCEVKPDGICEHGYPSWLVYLEII